MNKLYKLFIVLAVGFAPLNNAHATHVAGSELIYEWLRDSTYRFTFKFFDDCSGSFHALDEFFLCYYNPCNGYNGSMSMRKVSLLPGNMPNGTPINTGCPGVQTKCEDRNAVIPGFREWWYIGDLTLPSRCDNWIFSVSVHARNASTNLAQAQNFNMYIEATLNNLDSAGFGNHNSASFSSPYFNIKPIPYVCINVPMNYSGGPVDPDGDRLVYEFINPRYIGMGSLTTPANLGRNCRPQYTPVDQIYTTPYGLAYPFESSTPFRFDTTTSIFSFTPSTISKNTVSIRINKFRNGVKLGSVMRDVQFQVIACQNTPVDLNVIPTTVTRARNVNGTIEACLDVPFRFCIKTIAGLAGSLLHVESDHATVMPGSVATTVNQLTDSVLTCFSWTGTDTGLYMITLRVLDSTCRAPGVIVPQTFVIPVYIRQKEETYVRAEICQGEALEIMSNGAVNVRWSVMPGGDDLSSMSCTSCPNPVVRPVRSTTYVAGYDAVGSCGTSDTMDVFVTENKIEMTPSGELTVCHPDSMLTLSAIASGPRPLLSAPCGLAPLPLQISDDTTEIIPVPGVHTTGNNVYSTPFNGNYYTARHQYLLRSADLYRTGMAPGTLNGIAFYIPAFSGTASFEHFSISVGCTSDPLDKGGQFTSGGVPVYTSSVPVLVSSQGGWFDLQFDHSYNWDGVSDLIIDICYANTAGTTPVFTSYYATDYPATMYAYNYGGNICTGGPYVTTQAMLIDELPRMRFSWTMAPEQDFSYSWSGSVFEPGDAGDTVRTRLAKSSVIIVTAEGRNGCTPSDTLHVTIPVHDYVVTADTVICEGESVLLYVKDEGPDRVAFSARWYNGFWNDPLFLSCVDCKETIATPDATTHYRILTTDVYGCVDSFAVSVGVDSFKQVRIRQAPEITVPYRMSYQLEAYGADQYRWTPDTWMNNASVANPLISPERNIVYRVEGRSGVCISHDSILVVVDVRGLIFVPSAFTPNGDGLNDEFRIANFTFQELEFFHVFNRFGELVFTTIDGKKGWDGAWKGIPQETGVYFYHIQVRFPDGKTETFKGDLTLVR